MGLLHAKSPVLYSSRPLDYAAIKVAGFAEIMTFIPTPQQHCCRAAEVAQVWRVIIGRDSAVTLLTLDFRLLETLATPKDRHWGPDSALTGDHQTAAIKSPQMNTVDQFNLLAIAQCVLLVH